MKNAGAGQKVPRPLPPRIANLARTGTILAPQKSDNSAPMKRARTRWLAEFDLIDKALQTPARLSRGEQTKLWLATLFTLRPQLWLLDEPHQCGLDARGIAILESQILEHRDSGGIVLFSSQWPPHARRIAQRVILLHKSQMAYEGRIDAISENFGSRDPNMTAILRLLESESTGTVL